MRTVSQSRPRRLLAVAGRVAVGRLPPPVAAVAWAWVGAVGVAERATVGAVVAVPGGGMAVGAVVTLAVGRGAVALGGTGVGGAVVGGAVVGGAVVAVAAGRVGAGVGGVGAPGRQAVTLMKRTRVRHRLKARMAWLSKAGQSLLLTSIVLRRDKSIRRDKTLPSGRMFPCALCNPVATRAQHRSSTLKESISPLLPVLLSASSASALTVRVPCGILAAHLTQCCDTRGYTRAYA